MDIIGRRIRLTVGVKSHEEANDLLDFFANLINLEN